GQTRLPAGPDARIRIEERRQHASVGDRLMAFITEGLRSAGRGDAGADDTRPGDGGAGNRRAVLRRAVSFAGGEVSGAHRGETRVRRHDGAQDRSWCGYLPDAVAL